MVGTWGTRRSREINGCQHTCRGFLARLWGVCSGSLCKIGVVGLVIDVFIQELRGDIRKCDKCNKPSISYG